MSSDSNEYTTSGNKTDDVIQQPEFSRFREMFWPVHKNELKKFAPMSLMMMFILFIYTIVRDSKDSLIVSDAYQGGAYLLSFMKLWVVMPSAIIFMAIFVKLANKLSQEKLFYAITSFFVIFFCLFSFVLYPFSNYICLSHETIDSLINSVESIKGVGIALKSLVVIIGNWPKALFYIMAELWGSVVLSALFWQFANMITKTKEAKRFYPFYALIGNVGLILSGIIIKKSATYDSKGHMDFGASLRIITCTIAISGVLLLLTYRWIQKNVLTDKRLYDPDQGTNNKKKKPKMGFFESIKYVFTSSYLLKLTMLIVGYGLAINLFEQLWKALMEIMVVRDGVKDTVMYNSIMGNLSLTTGVITMIATFVGINALKKFKWRTVALFTPVSLLVIGAVFFVQVFIAKNSGADPLEFSFGLGTSIAFCKSAVYYAVFMGLIGNAMGKGVKYSMFDSTLQMAYLPLDPEIKTKGQAAVSIIGGRAGKAGGSAVVFLLTNIFGTSKVMDVSVYISIIFFILVALWIMCVFSLSKEYESKLSETSKH